MRRVALIGHSGAGKTACLRELKTRDGMNIDPVAADMDELGWPLSLNEGIALSTMRKALTWLVAPTTPQIVAVRNDEMMLKALVSAKRQRAYATEFSQVHWVYLCKPISELTKHLKERGNSPQVKYTIDSYSRFDRDIYRLLADVKISCSRKSTAEVADRVCRILRRP